VRSVPHVLRSRLAVIAAFALLVAGMAIGWAVAQSGEPTVTRTALGAGKPKGAPGRSLALSRVVIPPGAQLALHHHEGTQVAFIQSGVLTYTVESGSVKVMKGAADQNPKVVRTISGGKTGKIRAGEWIVEQPSAHHSAANNGPKRIVIYLATLLKEGAPPSTPG
jgi:quercetin dioxygenase-like cupin family protein